MVIVRFQGTCGNQLWQYAVARVYAEKHGHQLRKDTSHAIRDDLVHFSNAVDLDAGYASNGFIPESTVKFIDGHFHDFVPFNV